MLQHSNLRHLLNIYKVKKGILMCENYTVMKSIKDIQKSFNDLNQSRYVATEFDFYQI